MDVEAVLVQHLVARGCRVGVCAQAQLGSRQVEVGRLFDVGRPGLGVGRKPRVVLHQGDGPGVPLGRPRPAARLEERIAGVLGRIGGVQLFGLRQLPRLLGLGQRRQCDVPLDTDPAGHAQGRVAGVAIRVSGVRRDERALALGHLAHCLIQGFGHLLLIHHELQLVAGGAVQEGGARRAVGAQHAPNNSDLDCRPGRGAGPRLGLGQSLFDHAWHHLFHHLPRYQLQAAGKGGGGARGAVRGRQLQGHLLPFLHGAQGHGQPLGRRVRQGEFSALVRRHQGGRGVGGGARGPQRVLDQDLVAVGRRLPPLALGQHRLDHPAVAGQVFDRLPAE